MIQAALAQALPQALQLASAIGAFADQQKLQTAAQTGNSEEHIQRQLSEGLKPQQERQAYGGVPIAPPDAFTTKLTPEHETKFQSWRNTWAPKDSGADYDLRGAYTEGLLPDEQTGHWNDRYKKPNHPTFSVESAYAQHGNPGHWTGKDGDIYVPGPPPSPLNPFEGGYNSPAGKLATQGIGLLKRGSEAVKGLLSGSTSQPQAETIAPKPGASRNMDQNRQLEQLRRSGD